VDIGIPFSGYEFSAGEDALTVTLLAGLSRNPPLPSRGEEKGEKKRGKEKMYR
jgi:hypothetical protein